MNLSNLVFYRDTFINREISFILGVSYKYIDNFDKYDYNGFLFLSDEQSVFELEKYKLRDKICYYTLEDLCDYFDYLNREYIETLDRSVTRNLEEIEKIYNLDLALSEMLIKVLFSKPRNIDCKILENELNIDSFGDVWGCCPTWVKSFGNIFDDDIYDNYLARIIKLSSINKTFCFCNLYMCKYCDSEYLDKFDEKVDFNISNIPKQLTLSIDMTCNLRCNSCRKELMIADKEERDFSLCIVEKLKEMQWLNKSCLLLAGNGEVFFSPVYLSILKDKSISAKTIKIMSNGILFTGDKWSLIENKYDEIYVSISVDAASKEIYKKLRHGNFDVLIKNLKMLSKLKREGKLSFFQLNYVIQKDNLCDVIDFIKLGKELGVDVINFTKLNDWDVVERDEYLDNCLIVDDCVTNELFDVFQNPLFKDETIDISSFDIYIKNYKKRNKLN